MTQRLAGSVALVAGAARGAGRGIARMLGEAGATVYCTGRSARGAPAAGTPHGGRAETVEETAELVGEAGGTGIAVRVDHAAPAEVAAIVRRIEAERGRLDVLVNVLGGAQVTDYRPFWEQDAEKGWALVSQWVWPHLVTARAALPLMVRQRSGLLVEIIEGEALAVQQQSYFDLAHTMLKRLAYSLAEELAPHGVTALALAPGFMRTEVVLDHLKATEADWQRVAETSAEARGYGFAGSESPCFVGRAVVALAADPEVRRWSGSVCSSWGLAAEYGFTDVDGRRPDWGRYLAEHFPALAFAAPQTGHRWTVTRTGG